MSSTSERTGGKVGEDEHSQKEKTEADNYTHKYVGRKGIRQRCRPTACLHKVCLLTNNFLTTTSITYKKLISITC